MTEELKEVELFPVTAKELAYLIQKCRFVDLAFGTGGAALQWEIKDPIPEAVIELARLRGVLEENMHGAGI